LVKFYQLTKTRRKMERRAEARLPVIADCWLVGGWWLASVLSLTTAKIAVTSTARIFGPAATRSISLEEPVLASFWRPRLVYRQGTIIEGKPVELTDRFAGLFIGTHRNEPKPTRLTGEFILNDLYINDRASLSEQILQIQLGGRERKITYVQFSRHK
jgi:hypothetical protein